MRAVTTTRANAPGTDAPLLTKEFLLLIVSGFFALCGFSSTLPLVPRYVEGELGGGKVAVGIAVGIFSLSAVKRRQSKKDRNLRASHHPRSSQQQLAAGIWPRINACTGHIIISVVSYSCNLDKELCLKELVNQIRLSSLVKRALFP